MDQQKSLIEKYIAAYNSFDVPAMIACLHPKVTFLNYVDGKANVSTKGIKKFKKQAESAIPIFSERKQKVKSWKFEDEKLRVEIDYEGVLAIDLPTGKKAGEVMKLKGTSVFTFKGDKIVRVEDYS